MYPAGRRSARVRRRWATASRSGYGAKRALSRQSWNGRRRPLIEIDENELQLAGSLDVNRHGLAGLCLAHGIDEILEALDRAIVECIHDVSVAQAGGGRRAVLQRTHDDGAGQFA